MRKIIVEAEVSLDGVVNNPDIWAEIFKYHSEDVTDYLNNLISCSLFRMPSFWGAKPMKYLRKCGLNEKVKWHIELMACPNTLLLRHLNNHLIGTQI